MIRNYKQFTSEIQSRINPDLYEFEKDFRTELSSISYSDALTFVRMAMKGVAPEYTQKSKEAGERVKAHLDRELTDKTFKYQGSVMTNTHIRGYSDIDLLVISDKFYQCDPVSINTTLLNVANNPLTSKQVENLADEKARMGTYQGTWHSDLSKLRLDSERVLSSIYNDCNVSKPKSIKIKNLSLNREVDIVIANWHDNARSIINGKGDYRGVQVYDKLKNTRSEADYPFLSILRINTKSSETNGRLKKMIRFLKNVKAFSEQEVSLTSFDFNAICYDINTNVYKNLPFYKLVEVVYNQLQSLSENRYLSDSLKSVDGEEHIFRGKPEKLDNLKVLMTELEEILADLIKTRLYA